MLHFCVLRPGYFNSSGIWTIGERQFVKIARTSVCPNRLASPAGVKPHLKVEHKLKATSYMISRIS